MGFRLLPYQPALILQPSFSAVLDLLLVHVFVYARYRHERQQQLIHLLVILPVRHSVDALHEVNQKHLQPLHEPFSSLLMTYSKSFSFIYACLKH